MIIQRLKCRNCDYDVWSNSVDRGITCPDCGRDSLCVVEIKSREPTEGTTFQDDLYSEDPKSD